MKRVLILVLDSLGVGYMEDVRESRTQDIGANTFAHILDQAEGLYLPTFEELGIYQILKHPKLEERPAKAAYGCLNLQHFGADSYAGHQEIMGTIPVKPSLIPFSEVIYKVKDFLIQEGFAVRIPDEENPVLLVNEAIIVADNIETDYGQIYNVSGCLDKVSFDKVVQVGKAVRKITEVSRVIALGGEDVLLENMLAAVERRKDGLVGMNCPKSGIYHQGYLSLHMGYGVEPDKQVSSILVAAGKEVILVGKMQDVISCEGAIKIPAVPTEKVMEDTIKAFLAMKEGLVSSTVQETDLAGHAEDPTLYGRKLMIVDRYLKDLLPQMTAEDLLIITGDHGNDPTIGHSQHTREKTILLAYSPGLSGNISLGERHTLADIAATAAQALGVSAPQDGESFLWK
ncbi:phosphopentomutase [Clostridiales bacterium COT073_COT-073]|nr:phosphopentomutase [Clostridiales bacterium COT073_COT-073]